MPILKATLDTQDMRYEAGCDDTIMQLQLQLQLHVHAEVEVPLFNNKR